MPVSYPTTHHERISQLNAIYRSNISQEIYLPFGYPWGLYGAFIVLLYFVIPHGRSPRLYGARWVVWGLNFVYAIYTIKNTRAQGAVLAYAVGFGMGWSILWTTTTLLVYDGQQEFFRIERSSRKNEGGSSADSASRNTALNLQEGRGRQKNDCYAWRPFPTSSFLHRLDWVVDLMVSFRGVTWSWRIANLPDPPVQVLEVPRDWNARHIRSARVKRNTYTKKEALLRTSLLNFIKGYILVDVLKTLSLHDPFFWGFTDAQPPSHFPSLIRSSATLTRTYRLILAQLGIYYTLQTAFQLGPLLFVGLLGSTTIGVSGEYWVYPPEWGSYHSVFDRGLAGWWGEWWHQTFRFFFDAPAKRAVQLCGMEQSSLLAKTSHLFIAFSLSGFVHGCASYTSIGDTRPLRGAFLFFLLQPVGILIQRAVSQRLAALGISHRTPTLVKHVANFVFVHIWFFYTAPLLVDDAAQGGQFLWEPVPVSFARALGLGTVGDSWWCWNGPFYSWHRGKYAFQSGFVT
jgi:hypothetical protein